MAPNYTMRDIIDGSNKNMFGPKPDLSSTGAPYTAANPPQVTGVYGFSFVYSPQSGASIGTWQLRYNPDVYGGGYDGVNYVEYSPTANPITVGWYWDFTDANDIANFGDLVYKRGNGTIVQNGDNDITDPADPNAFYDKTDGFKAYPLYLVEQRTDLSSARWLKTIVLWSGANGYTSGALTVAPRTFYIAPWNTPGNLGSSPPYGWNPNEPIVSHIGLERVGTQNYYTLDFDTYLNPTQTPLTYNGYTWPTPLNGPVSTTLWVP
jgi:hypothetical protein